jgi:hypothetical protein
MNANLEKIVHTMLDKFTNPEAITDFIAYCTDYEDYDDETVAEEDVKFWWEEYKSEQYIKNKKY